MKLCRFGEPGAEHPAVLDGDQRFDVSAWGQDYDEKFFGSGGIDSLREWFRTNRANCPRVPADVRHASAVCRPSKVICIGLNYRKHAEASGTELPTEPILFFKATSAVCGPYDDLVLPRGSRKSDWEIELAVVIEKRTSYVDKENALNHVAGYMVHNDYSEREFQFERGGQYVKGKSADTFAPLGPVLATRDEIPDPQRLDLWLKVNGETLQEANTSDMAFNVAELVSYISQFMTLLPGDVISTGTPSGVGNGFDPPWFLKPGDVVECGITGLGISKQRVVAWQPRG
jgi:2-keto-4-pentenoate hydratase/2-oxohepta-3-ene-1,7-dioic acid hydratase in catechol pathway